MIFFNEKNLLKFLRNKNFLWFFWFQKVSVSNEEKGKNMGRII